MKKVLCKNAFCNFADKGNQINGCCVCIRKVYKMKCIAGENNGISWRYNKSKS